MMQWQPIMSIAERERLAAATRGVYRFQFSDGTVADEFEVNGMLPIRYLRIPTPPEPFGRWRGR